MRKTAKNELLGNSGLCNSLIYVLMSFLLEKIRY